MPKSTFRTIKKGEKVSIVLDVEEYEKLMEDLEELEAIRAFDAAKSSGETAIPFEQAVREIERQRK